MKRLFCIILPLALLVMLSACAIPLFTETYSNPTEAPAGQPESPDGLPSGVYYIPYLITTTDQATGDKYVTEYIQSATGNGPIPDGLVYTMESHDGTKQELRREDWLLDENYNIISHTVTVNGEVAESFTYALTYDESNRLLRKVCLSGDEEVYTEEYTYDPSGNLVSSSRYVGDVLESRLEMVYDKNGRLLTETAYATDGSITERKEHSFDETKLSDTILTCDGSGECIGTQIDYYNPAGYMIQTHILTPDGELISLTVYLPNKYTVY